ncbi:MAG TPA: DUF2059 domain-containing protein [Steroidobacteraceae bacterium]
MKKLYAGVCALLFFAGAAAAGTAAANDAPASDASIREMLELTSARQLIDTMKGQIATMTNSAVRDAIRGQPITPERQAILDRMAAKMSAVTTDLLNWDTLLPIYLRTYRASFTQGEIDGVIRFYKSPAGKAYVKKTPLVMQNVMREMQGLAKQVQDGMGAIQQESMQELKDLQDKNDKK